MANHDAPCVLQLAPVQFNLHSDLHFVLTYTNKTMKPIIIIGAGLAGYTLAREFRKLDKTTPLVMITADDGGFYSKPMLSNAFAQGKLAHQLVSQSAAQMAAQINAEIVTETPVERIDTDNNVVITATGSHEFSKLVLAVGAQAIRLNIAGDAAQEVLSVNHVIDYSVFRQQLMGAMKNDAPARVTILGAGLIGCEFADDLAGAAHPVTLIDPAPLPLAALASPALSQGLHDALVARGITLQLGTTATQIDRKDDALHITLADGCQLETDLVLSAVGLRPDLTLAKSAALATGRGIIIDSTGQSSNPDIYALGDCAEYTVDLEGTTRPLPYIAPLMTAARAIARTLTGDVTEIDLKPAPVLVKTPSYPLALLPPPPQAIATGHWENTAEDNKTISRFVDALGSVVGFGVSPHDSTTRQRLLAELEQ